MKRVCLLLLFFVLLVFVVACSDDDAPQAPNLALVSLSVTSGTLSPAFTPAITAYMVNVPNAVAEITVTGTAADTNNTVSCIPLQPTPLTVGSNLIIVRVVTADLKATNAYHIVVYRVSTNANLASLGVTTGTLVPPFDPSTTSYTINTYVSNSAVLNAVAEHAQASVVIPALSDGSNQLVVRVTAEDGTTTKDYTIRVYRMGADYVSANFGTLTLKYVPAGSFQRDVTAANISSVSAFHISRTEITRSQYSTIMGTDPANTTYSTSTSDPVQMVNWYHAIAFCNKFSISEGFVPVYSVSGVDFTNLSHSNIPVTNNTIWNAATADWDANGYRLPTEMEWMWAAMGAQMGADPFVVKTAGYHKPFAGSDGSNDIGDYAWYGCYSEGSATTATTTVVGSKLPNELGICDMTGNVQEWCWDWYGSHPAGYLADYRGAAPDTERITHGMSFNYDESFCYLDFRRNAPPDEEERYFGIRVVRP